MSNIEYLYRYTSLESLALILKSRQIRLNPLDKMDDLQEQKTADVENLGKFVFISSWTEESDESIPMWRMYTDPRAGVRIKIRKNPFVWHGTKGSDIVEKIGLHAVDMKSLNGKLPTFLDMSELMDKGYYSVQAFGGKILEQVTYTNEIEKLEPVISHIEGNKMTLELNKLGRHKNTYWSFQKEWRYIMTFIPFDFKSDVGTMELKFNLTANKLLHGIETPPFRFYNLDIASEAFEEMEITCSPQMSAGNKILLDALVEKYNPHAAVCESGLLGKL